MGSKLQHLIIFVSHLISLHVRKILILGKLSWIQTRQDKVITHAVFSFLMFHLINERKYVLLLLASNFAIIHKVVS